MKASTAKRLAWSLFTATAALAIAQGVLVVSGSTPLVDPEGGLNSFPLITVGCVLGALVGAMVATRQPRNPIGWLFLAGQLGTGIGLVSQAYASRVLQDGALGPPLAGQLATVVASALGASWALAVLAAVFLLFPDGSLPSRRWRVVLWALPVPQIAVLVSTLIVVPIDSITRADELSPLVSTVGPISALVSVLLLLLSLVALVLRLRRSRGEQRQQLRWITASAFALVAGFALANLAGLGTGPGRVWAVVPLFLAYISVPIAAGVAILRYRLYDIDLVINRAVVGAAVVIFVTLGYVTAVVLLGALVGGRVSEQYWASVVATALVALAFQPLRRGVQRLGDRVVYGRRAAPYQALADLGRRLAQAVSLEQVLPGIAEVSGRSIGAAQATVRLAVAGERRRRRTLADAAGARPPGRQRVCAAGVGRRRATRRDHGAYAGGTAGLRHGQDPAGGHRHPSRAGDAVCPARGTAASPGGSGRRADRGARGLPASAAGRPGIATPATDPGGQRGGTASSEPAPGRDRSGIGCDRPGRGESGCWTRPRKQPTRRWRRCETSPAASSLPCSPEGDWPRRFACTPRAPGAAWS